MSSLLVGLMVFPFSMIDSDNSVADLTVVVEAQNWRTDPTASVVGTLKGTIVELGS